jgi:hypothetical protein
MADPLCCVCGFPTSCCRLVPLTWAEGGGPVRDDGFDIGRMVVATRRKPNDVMLCLDCIRQIKRLPFGDLNAAPIVIRPDEEPPF